MIVVMIKNPETLVVRLEARNMSGLRLLTKFTLLHSLSMGQFDADLYSLSQNLNLNRHKSEVVGDLKAFLASKCH